jgi:hypothetical protein
MIAARAVPKLNRASKWPRIKRITGRGVPVMETMTKGGCRPVGTPPK